MFAKRFFYVCAGLLCLVLAYHFGAINATAQTPAAGEVAVSMGSFMASEAVPLPTYRDGTTALLSECSWIVSPRYINATRYGGTVHRCEAFGNEVDGLVMGWLTPDDVNDRSHASYLIVAVRSGGATPARVQSFGSMKARYRGERGAAQPTQDR